MEVAPILPSFSFLQPKHDEDINIIMIVLKTIFLSILKNFSLRVFGYIWEG